MRREWRVATVSDVTVSTFYHLVTCAVTSLVTVIGLFLSFLLSIQTFLFTHRVNIENLIAFVLFENTNYTLYWKIWLLLMYRLLYFKLILVCMIQFLLCKYYISCIGQVPINKLELELSSYFDSLRDQFILFIHWGQWLWIKIFLTGII